jgi:carbonic anhydrase
VVGIDAMEAPLMTATESLLSHAREYAASFNATGRSAPPRLGVAVVACMDARLDVNGLLGLGVGDAHVIRNAGGTITDDVIRSLTVSQRLLGTREIILIHHSECGMTSFDEAEFKASIAAETGLRPCWAVETFADVAEELRQSLRRVRTNPFLPHTDQVRAFVYSVTDGALTEIREHVSEQVG